MRDSLDVGFAFQKGTNKYPNRSKFNMNTYYGLDRDLWVDVACGGLWRTS